MTNPIEPWLNNKYIGKNIIILDEVQSTNDYAKELLHLNPVNGTVILAKRQIKGRGQQGHSWFSADGGLYYTCILNTNFVQNITMITLACGLACNEAIFDLSGIDTTLKWVNDIQIYSKKLGGILTESRVRGKNTKLIIGIGININNKTCNLPENIRNQSTTLFEETCRCYNINHLAGLLSNSLEKYFDLYEAGNYKVIKLLWFKKSNILGKKVKIIKFNYPYEGLIIDLDINGALIIQDNEGNIHYIINTSDIIEIN